VEERQLHKSIMETTQKFRRAQKLRAGPYTCFKGCTGRHGCGFVLPRSLLIPEMIGTEEKQMYEVEIDGTIKANE